MSDELFAAFKAAMVGRTCRVRRREGDWAFAFGDDCGLTTGASWRLVGPERLAVADGDDGQLFGRTTPVDVERDANAILARLAVASVAIKPITCDLHVSFDTGVTLDVINTSSGYEAWQAYFVSETGPMTLVAQGGGGLFASLA